jgi:hypothetical protein
MQKRKYNYLFTLIFLTISFYSRLPHLFSKYKDQLEQDLKKSLTCADDFDVEKHHHNYSKEKIQMLAEQVMYCLQPAVRSNITVFNLNSDNDLSETIFRSISKGKSIYFLNVDLYSSIYVAYKKLLNEKKKESFDNKSDNVQFDTKIKEQMERDPLLELAMDWNCIDVAKEFVFENSLDNIIVKILIQVCIDIICNLRIPVGYSKML